MPNGDNPMPCFTHLSLQPSIWLSSASLRRSKIVPPADITKRRSNLSADLLRYPISSVCLSRSVVCIIVGASSERAEGGAFRSFPPRKIATNLMDAGGVILTNGRSRFRFNRNKTPFIHESPWASSFVSRISSECVAFTEYYHSRRG